jgi:hypothetical protein
VKLRHDEMQIEDIRDESGPSAARGSHLPHPAEMDAYMEENKALIGKLDKQLAKSRHANEGAAAAGGPAKTGYPGEGSPDPGTDPVDGQDEGRVYHHRGGQRRHHFRAGSQAYRPAENHPRKQTTLNTGYILYGDRQHLFDKGVLQSEGGLLGKNVKLTSKLDQGLFSPIDIKKVQEINIGVTRKQKALTIHPADSFYFVKTDGQTYLKITDPDRFWSVSKYLVVVIEG